MTRTLPRLAGVAGCLALSVAVSACGSTVAMTGTTSSCGLDAQQPLGSTTTTGERPGVSVTQPAPGAPALPGASGPSGGGATAQAPPGAGGGTTVGAAARGPAPKGPLTFGLLDVGSSTSAVGAIGGQAQTTVNEQNLARAFIRYFNAHGGIAGRQLRAVEYTQEPTSDDYQRDMEAACARFTQDNKVNVVLRAVLGGVTPENYEECLTKAGVTSLEMTYANGDEPMLARHPRLYNVAAPSVDRRERAVLNGLTRSGYLSSRNTIGVLVEDCAENQRAYKNTVLPLARSLGLRIQARTVGCLGGFSDVGAFSAQVQSAVLPFRSAGVDRVTFVSVWEPLMLLFFETGAANQGWRPSYAVSGNSAIGSTEGQFTDEQRSRMRGVGWAPTTDTGTPLNNATTRKCDAMARSEGIAPQTQGDVALLRLVCDLFLVYRAAVEAAGGHDDAVSLAAGLATASKTHLSASVLGGKLLLGRGRQDAPTQAAEFGFVGGCSCFRYLSAPRPMT